jgi:hypothetical protein
MVAFVLCEAQNISRTLKITSSHGDLASGIKYAAVGFFFSSVTPSATGGQPMQLVSMKKDGLDIGKSVIALFVDSASYQMASIIYGVLGFVYIKSTGFDMPKLFIAMFGVGLFLNFIVLLLIVK